MIEGELSTLLSASPTFIFNDESFTVLTTSPSTLDVKLNKVFQNCNANDNEEEFSDVTLSKQLHHPDKRSKTLSSDEISKNDMSVKALRLLRIPSLVESGTNRQLIVKLEKHGNGELTSSKYLSDATMSTEYLMSEQKKCSTTSDVTSSDYSEIVPANGHEDSICRSSSTTATTISNVTTMLSNGTNETNGQIIQMTTTSSSNQNTESHTKELLDEALDSVKSVLMQTFKKNLESGGDLNALKTTLSSDEVAEAFLAKLRQSLKRDADFEPKKVDQINTNTDISSSQTPIVTNSVVSSVMNVASSYSSSPLLSSIITKSTSPTIPMPSSPQSQNISVNNSKRKATTNSSSVEDSIEEELTKRLLSDILQFNLDIVFVGVNPSMYAVNKGHHYGGPGNHFWKLLHMSGLIPTGLNANDDYRMPQYGIGFTNIVQRPSKAGSDITKDEITAGAEELMQKIKMFKPKIIAFNGRGIYEVYAGNKHFHYGKQPDSFPGTDTHVFVMPSSSARCSQLPRAEDKLPFYIGLRKLRDFVKGSLQSLNEAEITFPDIKIKDTDDVLQKTVIRISNKPFSELSAEALKCYGDKIPSGQMVSKYTPSTQTVICPSPSLSPSPTSSPNLVFNTDAITTQTMSILHNASHPQNETLITQDQQAQRVYLQNDGCYSPSPPPTPSPIHQQQRSATNSFTDNSPANTSAAVLAALANGGFNSPSTPASPQVQTVYVTGPFSQQQSISYSTAGSFANNSPSIANARATPISSTAHSSYIVHPSSHASSSNYQKSSSFQNNSRVLISNSSPEPLPSFDTILNSQTLLNRTQNICSKDAISSQQSTTKPTLIVLPSTIKPVTTTPFSSTSAASSSIILSKPTSSANLIEKRPINTNDDWLYVRYEHESHTTNSDLFRFSYVVDEHSPSLNKRLRYVSINDL